MIETLDSLQTAGLSEKEAQTYLDLLQHGESQTGKICTRTDIPSSHIYTILDSLVEKGLVNYKLVNNIKVFRASDPDALAHLFEEKERQLRDDKQSLLGAIESLKDMPVDTERLSDFKYFEGVRGIKSLYTEIINSWSEGDEYYIAAAPFESFRRLEAFFVNKVHTKRVADGVKLRMLVNSAGKRFGKQRAKMPLTRVRYLDIDTKTEYGVLNDYFFLVTYAKNPYGLLIKDEHFANTYKVFFEMLWKSAQDE